LASRRKHDLPLLLAPLMVCAGWAAGALSAQKPAAGLAIVDVLFEDDRGDLHRDFTMRAGGEAVLAFRVEGFERQRVESESGLPEQRVHLRHEIELQDPQGVLVLPGEKGEVETILGPRDDQWRPKINWSARLPSYAPSGEYRVQLRVRDLLAGEEINRSVAFRVRGESFRPAESLEVQQAEYASSQDGPWYSRRYFALKDAIHARFKIAGFRVSPEKEVWIEQDWKVLDSEGKTIVSQENAVVNKQQSFYPPRVFSTVFDLRLKDPKPGEYTLRIDVRDRIGEQSLSYDSSFFLRP